MAREETRKSDTVSEVKHRHGNSAASLKLPRVIKSIIYIKMHKEKHSFTSHPAAKNPKHNKLAVTDIREKPVDFFNNTARASTLAPAIILRT